VGVFQENNEENVMYFYNTMGGAFLLHFDLLPT
jgi:hypothetical protein